MLMVENLEINKEKGYVLISVNPKIFPLDVVYSAAYSFIDKCFVLIDGDPKEEIFVELRPKKDEDLREIGLSFNNELVNYANYAMLGTRNAKLREEILRRVLLTNNVEEEFKKDETVAVPWKEEAETEEDKSYLDDPEGIAVPWEKKK